MYANPKLSEGLLAKIKELSTFQSKIQRGSIQWLLINEALHELHSKRSTLRMQLDPHATTY